MRRVHPILRVTLLSLALAFVSGAIAASPADFPITPPAPAPAPKLSVPTPSMHTLANGLRVISVQRDRLPLVTAQLLLRSGGEQDPADKAGLAATHRDPAHQGCGRQDRATDRRRSRSARRLARCLGGLGQQRRRHHRHHAETAAGAGIARRRGAASGLQRRGIEARANPGDRRIAAVAERAEFAGAAGGRARGIRQRRLRAFARRYAGVVGKLTRDDVQALHAALYRPDNAILVLTGDITAAQAEQLAQASFGDWKAPAAPLPAAPVGVGASALPALLVIDQHGAGQAGVVAAHVAPPRNDAGLLRRHGRRRGAGRFLLGTISTRKSGSSAACPTVPAATWTRAAMPASGWPRRRPRIPRRRRWSS